MLSNDLSDTGGLVAVEQVATSYLGVPVTIDFDGTFRYDPREILDYLAEDELAEDYFTYAASDETGLATEATVFVTVQGKNDAPRMRADASTALNYASPSKVTRFSGESGVLASWEDVDRADRLSILGVGATEPTGAEQTMSTLTRLNATVRMRRDGSFDYDPSTATGFPPPHGDTWEDSFEYWVSDGRAAPIRHEQSVSVRAGRELEYEYELLATTFSSIELETDNAESRFVDFADLGRGPSINNEGLAAFTGTYRDGDSLYPNVYARDVLTPGATARQLMSDALRLPEIGAPALSTMAFGHDVQVNDDGEVLAWRRLNALVKIGDLLAGEQTTLPLTYLETWDSAIADGAASQLIAMGDANLVASGMTLQSFDSVGS
ncbi:MAG TPA: Ig-like domain-containing protein, partial [Pirellulaceae bacterium]|nr:Ig-like domain-containing protein [Pirellulaceae bacterium]